MVSEPSEGPSLTSGPLSEPPSLPVKPRSLDIVDLMRESKYHLKPMNPSVLRKDFFWQAKDGACAQIDFI
jgi:hypothetical protein